MAFVHTADKARVLVNERSFSAKLSGVTLGHERAVGDTTTFADAGAKFVPGLAGGALTLNGFFEAGAAVHGELNSSVGVDNGLLVTAAPDGLAVGKPAFIAVGDMTDYDVSASVSDPVSFSVESQPDDGVDWGVSLHDLVARTATADGTSVDGTAATTGGGVASLHVTAASGSLPTLTVDIQDSADDVTFVDILTFTQATAATSERKTVSGTVRRFVRAQWTIGGTTPSFTFSTAFARR